LCSVAADRPPQKQSLQISLDAELLRIAVFTIQRQLGYHLPGFGRHAEAEMGLGTRRRTP
jgi:hypothetical protein